MKDRTAGIQCRDSINYEVNKYDLLKEWLSCGAELEAAFIYVNRGSWNDWRQHTAAQLREFLLTSIILVECAFSFLQTRKFVSLTLSPW